MRPNAPCPISQRPFSRANSRTRCASATGPEPLCCIRRNGVKAATVGDDPSRQDNRLSVFDRSARPRTPPSSPQTRQERHGQMTAKAPLHPRTACRRPRRRRTRAPPTRNVLVHRTDQVIRRLKDDGLDHLPPPISVEELRTEEALPGDTDRDRGFCPLTGDARLGRELLLAHCVLAYATSVVFDLAELVQPVVEHARVGLRLFLA